MTQVILDAPLRNKLHNLTEPLELCDESGRILARVLPVLDESQYERAEPPISAEELQRRKASTEWYTTAEVLAYLDTL
jgi:hypothetical protein